MAHIAELMVVPDNYIARELSPSRNQDVSDTSAAEGKGIEEEKYVWRMHQPAQARKLSLFPSKDKLHIAAAKIPDAELSQLLAMQATGISDKAQRILGTAVRAKPTEQTVIIRRRKVSVPELGPSPMTTVQEVAMDSPTIPGRPALHERSISAPGNSWRQHVFGESMLSCISGPLLDENAEMSLSMGSETSAPSSIESQPSRTSTPSNAPSRSKSPQHPNSPKKLAPLVIPATTSQRLAHQPSSSRLRSGSGPPDVPPKSGRTREERSPYPRPSPYTPMSASSTSLLSTSTAPTSISNTPISALPTLEGRSSPAPWSSGASVVPRSTTPVPIPRSPMGHTRGQSDSPQSSLNIPRSNPTGYTPSHRRHESESSASIMDRGRPKKRSETVPSSTSPPSTSTAEPPVKRSASRSNRSPSNPTPPPTSQPSIESQQPPRAPSRQEAQATFEHLPTGHSPTSAPSHLSASELATLRKQALGQATRFQVLAIRDVDALSRELRALDERCEYLRKTHRSLRSGRRNLHERMCSYLRSPRVAKFSQDSMLKQEEALKELDTSIDDWVSKLEQAENRRMRVRQKLLEHVAAAVILSPTAAPLPAATTTTQQHQQHITTMAINTHTHTHERMTDPNTPPRSPTKAQPSPERLERVVEGAELVSSSVVPSPNSSSNSKIAAYRQHRKMSDAESIRIYADSDVYALLADVEEEIERMGKLDVLDEGEKKIEVAVAVEVVEKKEKEDEEKVVEVKEVPLSPGIRLAPVAFEMPSKRRIA